MKHLFYLLFAAAFMACSSNGEPKTEEAQLPDVTQPEGTYHTVSLDFVKELADMEVTDEPITKAEAGTEDLYVINVFSKPASGGNYAQYAYGMFNKKEGMTVNLLDGNLYQFQVTLVKNYREVLARATDSTTYWGRSSFSKIDNKINIGSWEYRYYDASGSDLYVPERNSYSSYYRPILDRYYGELSDYEPIENGKIAIDLYRVVFGARVEVTGLTEGTLTFGMSSAPTITIRADSVYVPDNMYQLSNVSDVIRFVAQGKEQTEYFNVNVDWTNADGSRTIKIYSGDITVTRLKRTIFKITLKEGVVTKGDVGFTIEEAALTDGMVQEIEGTISGGQDTEITPGS